MVSMFEVVVFHRYVFGFVLGANASRFPCFVFSWGGKKKRQVFGAIGKQKMEVLVKKMFIRVFVLL